MHKQFDDVPEDGHSGIPKGWLLTYFGVIIWGIWYIWAFTPELAGWSQQASYEQAAETVKKEEKPVLYENPYEKDPKAIEVGRGLFADNCAVCHGEDLKGGVGPDLTAHLNYGETDKDKYISIFEGRPGGMPGFGDQLGRDRIWKVLAYVDSVREYGKEP